MDNFVFTDGQTKDFEAAVNEQMDKAIKHFERELVSIRTGRASVAMLDNVIVEVYGQTMKLKELATLAAPDARLLTIQPWDKGTIGDIDRAIKASDLGLAPLNDGTIIRLQLPMMSTERREELSKVLSKKTEECRVDIRNVRKDFQNEVRDAQKANKISEDFSKRLSDLLQKITDNFTAKANALQEKKDKELKLS